MIFKKEKDNAALLEEYLQSQNYHYINSAITAYKLAMNKLSGFCFNANEELIIAIIKIIAQCDKKTNFNKQFEFAETLYTNMQVDPEDKNQILNYLNNLNVCLNNPLIMECFDKIAPLYLLFEDKSIVQGIITHIINLEEIIEYIIEARQFYVDEHALFSAALNLDKKIENDEEAIKKQLAQDRENAGIYNIDYDILEIIMSTDLEQLSKQLESIKGEIKKLEGRKQKVIKRRIK